MYKLNVVAKDILLYDYLLDDEKPKDMLMRVAKTIASAEKTEEDKKYWAKRFYDTMMEGSWIPASPFLMNAGVNNMFSSCFVIGGLEDNLDDIFNVNKRSATVTKMGGGIGLNISKLREKGALVNSTRGESSGAVSFMQIFNATLTVVLQARRRGAGIIVLSVYHPDIESFIEVKSNHKEITNFNISVLVDDDFMIAVKEDKNITLKSPLGYDVREVSAKSIFDKIVNNARYHAEPGLIFKTAVNRDNPCVKNIGEIDSVNACGEIPLYDDEACNLSSINLQYFVDESKKVDYKKLKYITETITRFLDNSIDINNFPDDKIKAAVLRTRKLGIGVMGLHPMLIKKGLQYDSSKGRTFANGVMAKITQYAQEYSEELIKEGRELPSAWYGSTFEEEDVKLRNLSVTSCQPTGATQIIADEICASSGIETIFAIAYTRKVRGTDYKMVNSLFRDIGNSEGWMDSNLIDKIISNKGSCQGIKEVPKKWQKLFKTSFDMSWEDHVKMQSAIQETVTNAISKTINMPSTSSVEDVYNAFMLAWESDCKGITVYIQDSREDQVLSIADSKKNKYIPITPTLEVANSVRLKVETGCGSMWLFLIYDDNNNLREVSSQIGSSGGCQGMTMAVTRMISTMLKANIDPEVIIDQLQSVKCDVSMAAKKKNNKIGKSCGDGIGRQMARYLNGEIIPTKNNGSGKIQYEPLKLEQNPMFVCPDCGEYSLAKYDGCIQCTVCAYQRCQ